MKKIICVILTISVLSLSVFGCYVQAAETENSYDISDKERKLYNFLYGEGNWKIDSNGKVVNCYPYPEDSINIKLKNFIDSLLLRCSVLAPYADDIENLNKTFRDWFYKNQDSIDVDDDGNVSVGADAMQGFRSALSDQVYSLGCYKLIQENVTKEEMLSTLSSQNNENAVKNFNSLYDKYNFCISGVYLQDSVLYRSLIFFDKLQYPDAVKFYCLIDDSFCDSRYKVTYYSTVYNKLLGTYPGSSFGFGSVKDQSSSIDTSDTYIHKKYVQDSLMLYGDSIKVFSSEESAAYYYKCLLDETYQPKVYIYNNYSPSNTTINLNNVNNYDYEKIINNAYNTINNEKNTTIKVSGSISDNDLQLIIKNAIDLAINETGGGNGGGSGGGSGGDDGGSGGSSGTDYTGILNSILTYCKSISDVVTSSDSRLELLVNVADQNKTLITGISTSITDLGTSLSDIGVSVGNIEQYLKDISSQLKDLLGDDGSGGGGSLFDRLIDFLFRTLSNLLADLLGDVIKTIIGDLGKVTGPAKGLADAAQTKFPTSIPWDIIAIIGVMSAEPECPKFEIPFSVPRLGINETIKIDLSKADKVAELSRKMLTVTFLLFLVVQTRKLYGSMNNKN